MKSRYLLLAGIAVMACLAGCSDNSLDNGMAKILYKKVKKFCLALPYPMR